jgi:hypothetical protein
MPSSLNQFVLSRLSLLNQSISVKSGYGQLNSMHNLFTDPRIQQFSPVTLVRFLSLRSTNFCHEAPFRVPVYPEVYRALNEFSQFRSINLISIRHTQLRYDLGAD